MRIYRLVSLIGGAVSIKLESGRTYTQDEFGWRHSLDILEDDVADYKSAELDIEILNEISAIPDPFVEVFDV